METIIEEKKIERIEVNPGITQLKEDIKNMVNDQKELKNQRRTERLKGERIMPRYEAAWKHENNRNALRLRYAAYGLMRGKTFSVTENKYPEENHPLCEFQDKIDGLVKYYMTQEYEN